MSGGLTRTYTVLEGDESHPLIVSWGAPEEEADGAWYCEVTFAEAGQPVRTRRIFGVDAVQALLLAMQHVAADLYCHELYRHNGHVCWFERDDDLGLPTAEALREVVEARAGRFQHAERERELQREVIRTFDNGLATLTLNRPAALNALNTGMCRDMIEALLDWRDDPAIKAVMIDHAGERGFCAGGDIRSLAESAAEGGAAAFAFFHTEYRLNHLISVYPKPVITVMDGVTMGGGVGLAMPSTYRIATERTRFAMPETGIGLFPDVGGGWHLPRLHGRTGLWIVLTGARLGAADCELLGIATDVVVSESLPEMKAAMAREPEAIERILTELEADPGPAPIGALRDEIDRLFAGDSLEAVIEALEADGGEWALAQLEIMRPKSPLSSKVSFRLLAHEHPASLAGDLVTEYRLARRVVMQHDFTEGVRAVIVDKDNQPLWSPATPAGVSEAMVDAIFAPLPADQEWTPLPGL